MTGALARVFKQAEELPESAQEELAELIEQKLADMRWEELFATPESDRFLQQLAAEAIKEDEAGTTRESGKTW